MQDVLRRHAVALARKRSAAGEVTYYLSAPRFPWWQVRRNWRLFSHCRGMLRDREPGSRLVIERHKEAN